MQEDSAAAFLPITQLLRAPEPASKMAAALVMQLYRWRRCQA